MDFGEVVLKRARFFATLSFLLLSVVCTASSQETATQPHRSDAEGESSKSQYGFFKRLWNFYRDDWSGTGENEAELPRRIPPAPINSPPFPFADWPYGGAPVIGTPDNNVYRLMEAINGASSRVKVYGWIEPGVNVSTSKHT